MNFFLEVFSKIIFMVKYLDKLVKLSDFYNDKNMILSQYLLFLCYN